MMRIGLSGYVCATALLNRQAAKIVATPYMVRSIMRASRNKYSGMLLRMTGAAPRSVRLFEDDIAPSDEQMPTLRIGADLTMNYAVDDYTDPWRKPETVLLVHGIHDSG